MFGLLWSAERDDAAQYLVAFAVSAVVGLVFFLVRRFWNYKRAEVRCINGR